MSGRGYGVAVITAPSAYEHYIRARLASERGDHDLAIVELRMASAAQPGDPELRVALGEELLAAGQLQAAHREAAAATEDRPGDPRGWRLLGRVHAAQAEPREAAQALEHALSLAPTEEATYLMLAAAYRQLGDPVRALATYRRLVEDKPASAEGRFRYGRALASTEPAHAVAELDRAVALDPDHIDARVALAEILRRTGHPTQARDALRAAFDRSGNDAAVGERLYHILLENGDHDAAIELLRSIDARWRPAHIRLRLGAFMLQLRHPDEALRIGRQLVSADPSDQAARVLMARAYAQLGNTSEAVAACRQVPAESTAYVEARAFAAEILGRAGAPHEGLAIIEDALQRRPEEPRLVAAAARLHERLGDLAAARALLDAALVRAPLDEVLVYARASLEDRAHEPERAVAIMRRLLDTDADSVTALNFIGYSYADRNIDLEASERMLRRALQLQPDDAFVLDSIGWLHLRRGQLDDARAALERAGRLAPYEPEILFHLGELSLRRGEAGRARELFRQALLLGPVSPIRERLEDRLRTLEARAP